MRCNARKMKRNGMFPVGTKCRLRCRKGYRIDESQAPGKTKCQWHGEWSDLGNCVEEKCEPIDSLANGLVDPQNCTTMSQPLGSRCSFSCNQGFRMEGKKATSCSRRTKSWKHPIPQCVSDFPRPFIMCPGII